MSDNNNKPANANKRFFGRALNTEAQPKAVGALSEAQDQTTSESLGAVPSILEQVQWDDEAQQARQQAQQSAQKSRVLPPRSAKNSKAEPSDTAKRTAELRERLVQERKALQGAKAPLRQFVPADQAQTVQESKGNKPDAVQTPQAQPAQQQKPKNAPEQAQQALPKQSIPRQHLKPSDDKAAKPADKQSSASENYEAPNAPLVNPYALKMRQQKEQLAAIAKQNNSSQNSSEQSESEQDLSQAARMRATKQGLRGFKPQASVTQKVLAEPKARALSTKPLAREQAKQQTSEQATADTTIETASTEPAARRAIEPRPFESAALETLDKNFPGLVALDLHKSFLKRKVLDGVSLGVREGEAVGLLGPNGAGKTTSFYIVCGLLEADSGYIGLNKQDITGMAMFRRARSGIGYLPQDSSIFRGMTVAQNIEAALEIVIKNKQERRARLEELLEDFSIAHLRNTNAQALSGGERRRTEIARALASNPKFVLLDEPFAGVDPIAVGDIRALIQTLKTKGIGVLITDHNVRDTLNVVDRAYIIHQGRVLTSGSPEQIIENKDVQRVYLGDSFSLDHKQTSANAD